MATLAIAAVSHAGTTAVQWTEADGGNGHWYRHDFVPFPVGTEICSLDYAIEYGSSIGGHPVSITSEEENEFVLDVLPYFNGLYSTARIGCFRSSESAEWEWVTGEPFTYSNFISDSEKRTVDLYDEESSFGPGWRGSAWCFTVVENNGVGSTSLMVEWSDDCNGDGIVDYGQILDGSLADVDGNGVPDICEQESNAVQWTSDGGGNGHWYELRDGEGTSWNEQRETALSIGGDLACPVDASTNDFLGDLILSSGICTEFDYISLGGLQDENESNPTSGWSWVSGDGWDWTNWGTNEPNDGGGGEWALAISPGGGCLSSWNDINPTDTSWNLAYLVEWSADCNGDGIVDYGQILDGTLEDLDGNGIPDCCDDGSCLSSDPAQLIWGWGSNSDGQISIPEDLGYVVKLAGGAYHTAALLPDGTVQCWGRTSSGQCDVPAELFNVIDISAGDSHTIALQADGTVHTWGGGVNIQVPGGMGPAQAIGSGANHCLAILEDGTIRAWGSVDGTLELPDGSSSPVVVDGGADYSVALLADGSVYNWGGYDIGSVDDIIAIRVTNYNGLALTSTGDVVPFGRNWFGQGDVPFDLPPCQAVAIASESAVALTMDGDLICWGNADYGECVIPADLGSIDSIQGGGRYMLGWISFTDCNGDGLVDYGQILDGTLEDLDGNGIPDCCDDGSCLDTGDLTVCSTCTYTDIQSAINASDPGDVIQVGPGTYTSSSSSVINLPDKQLTIISSEGPESTIIDAQASRYGISISGNASNILIDGFTVTNGSGVTGAGLNADTIGTTTLQNIVFDNNSGSWEGGGAYITGGGSFLIDGCQFTNNDAFAGGGMAIKNQSTGSIRNCSFMNNNALQDDAGGLLLSNLDSTLVDTCEFDSNFSDDDGGGLWIGSCESPTVQDCIFTGNQSLQRGGGIHIQSSNDVMIQSCIITGNSANTGGGIFNTVSTVSLLNSSICANTPDQTVGSLSDLGGNYVAATCAAATVEVCPTGCEFNDIQSAVDYLGTIGGTIQVLPGIYTATSNPVVQLPATGITLVGIGNSETIIIDGEQARRCLGMDGSEDDDQSAASVIQNIRFINGSASGGGGDGIGDGGAAIIQSASPTFHNCLFEYNDAFDEGGAIYAWQSSPTIEGCTFRFNNAGSKGGAISAVSSSQLTIVANNIFTDNTTTGYGGAISMDSSTASLDDAVFTSNTGSDRGGAIFSWKSDLLIDSCDFTQNKADSTEGNGWHGVGGSIYARDNSLTINNSNFTANVAATLGGAIDTDDGCSINLADCEFMGNSSGVIGGAVRFDDGHPTLDIIERCRFINNVSSEGGGAQLERFSPRVINCQFEGNVANGKSPGEDGNGGAIFTHEAAISFIDCTISSNTAAGSGGGVFINSDVISIESSTICGNVPDQVQGSASDSDPANYIEDSCDGSLYSNWSNPAGGLYQSAGNWQSSQTPNVNSTVIFNLDGDYQVTFNANAEAHALRVRNGHPELNIGDNELIFANENSSAIIIGENSSEFASLTISSGELETGQTETVIGRETDATGELFIDGSGTTVELDSLFVGDRGQGHLELSGGAELETQLATLGIFTGSYGSATLSGSGTAQNTLWSCESTFTIGHGRLDIEHPAQLIIDTGQLVIRNKGRLAGDGDIQTGELVNYGSIEPTLNGEPLQLFGNYEQIGLFVARIAAADDYSQLDIQAEPGQTFSGFAELNGGLIAQLDNGYDPVIDSTFQILSASFGTQGAYDVALMPDLGDDKYMAVEYRNGLRGSAGVDLVVLPFEELLEFGSSDEIDLSALPVSMVAADFDNDGDDDVAVSSEGQISIYLNQSGDLELDQTIHNANMTAVELVAGDFNGDGFIDLAGANYAAGNFTVIINNSGTFLTAIDYPCSADGTLKPTCLTAADFDNDGLDDIAVGCQAPQQDDGLVQIWQSVPDRNTRSFVLNKAQDLPVGDTPGGIDPGQVEEDKDLDLGVTLVNENAVAILKNLGIGDGIEFDYDDDDDRYPVGQTPRSIVLGAIDTDDRIDILTANSGDGSISILLNATNDPDQDFRDSVNLPIGQDAQAVSLSDLDNDGDNDIAVIAIGDGDFDRSLSILRNDSLVSGNPDGNPTGQLLLAPAETFDDIIGIPILVDDGNINGDNLPDLITINEPGSNGLRDTPGTLGLVQRPDTLEPCDGDSDGDRVVGIDDLLVVLANYGPDGEDGDLDGDTDADVDDMLIVIANWGNNCQ